MTKFTELLKVKMITSSGGRRNSCRYSSLLNDGWNSSCLEGEYEDLELSARSAGEADDEPFTADKDSVTAAASVKFVVGDLSMDCDGGAMLSLEEVVATAMERKL